MLGATVMRFAVAEAFTQGENQLAMLTRHHALRHRRQMRLLRSTPAFLPNPPDHPKKRHQQQKFHAISSHQLFRQTKLNKSR
jgi:hypothetical protein